MSFDSILTIAIICVSLFYLWKYLKPNLFTKILNSQESQLDVLAKELWRLRTFQSWYIEKNQHQDFSEHVQRAYHQIQRHYDYEL